MNSNCTRETLIYSAVWYYGLALNSKLTSSIKMDAKSNSSSKQLFKTFLLTLKGLKLLKISIHRTEI